MSTIVKYGVINLICKMDGLTKTLRSEKITRHLIATNRSVTTYLGVKATDISGVFLGFTEGQMNLMQQFIHGDQEQDLYIGDHYYSQVITSNEGTIRALNPEATIWEVNITFTALDPIPKSVETGDDLY